MYDYVHVLHAMVCTCVMTGCVCVFLWGGYDCVYVCYDGAGAGDGRYLTGKEYVFQVEDSEGKICLTASFQLTFDLYYENITYNGSSYQTDVTVGNVLGVEMVGFL